MTNNTSLNSIAFVIALAMICLSLGCDQQRYKPSSWAPATGTDNTLPGVGLLNGESTEVDAAGTSLPGRNDTLPGRNSVSLPWRSGSQTLPRRGGTLPSRQQIAVRAPKKKVKPPLPSLADKPVWDVTEKREMPPVPGKPGLYMGEAEGLIRFPSTTVRRGSSSTLPGRNGTTLPARAKNSNWSTLPGRE